MSETPWIQLALRVSFFSFMPAMMVKVKLSILFKNKSKKRCYILKTSTNIMYSTVNVQNLVNVDIHH